MTSTHPNPVWIVIKVKAKKERQQAVKPLAGEKSGHNDKPGADSNQSEHRVEENVYRRSHLFSSLCLAFFHIWRVAMQMPNPIYVEVVESKRHSAEGEAIVSELPRTQ
jgi:hypothetical protein